MGKGGQKQVVLWVRVARKGSGTSGVLEDEGGVICNSGQMGNCIVVKDGHTDS